MSERLARAHTTNPGWRADGLALSVGYGFVYEVRFTT
jgi:hypothetical protein